SAAAQNWHKVQSTSAPPQIRALAIDANGVFYIAERTTGFYRSTDSGSTWTQINAGIAETGGWAIEIDPSDGNLYAGTLGSMTTTGHFYRSTDQGASWTQITGTPKFNTPNYDGTVFATNGSVILGAFWSPYPDSGVWHSTDGQTATESTKQPVG